MIKAQTQTPEYWGRNFALTESDIEQINNHFLETGRPQVINALVKVVIAHRVAEEARNVEQQLSGRTIYQPKKKYKVGEKLVFPTLQYVHGAVTAVRDGFNPQYSAFQVISVDMNGKQREFAAELADDHALNDDETSSLRQVLDVDQERLMLLYGQQVEQRLVQKLTEMPEFVRLGQEWFVKALMIEIGVGHLHLAEAILEINEGGPLPPEEIIPHLDLDPGVDVSVRRFSLNAALIDDDRFDEIAPVGQVQWFLRRLEPEAVRAAPERLVYTNIPYDRALLSPQLLALERELDDEWSDVEPAVAPEITVLALTFPHRWAGTLPLTARTRPLFPASTSPRQRILFIDEATKGEIPGWVVREGRYITGLEAWYEENEIPVGGFIHLRPGPRTGTVSLDYDRRRPQREWVRLATVVDNQIRFELMRRSIGCGYDDLLIVGTDVVAAVDALWRRVESQQRSVASLLADLFPQLANLTPQNTVHAKTLYSALNMLRRVPPGPIFAELVRHPAFQPVGDHYWRFDSSRWRSN